MMKGHHTQTLIPRVLSHTSQTRGSRIQTNKEISQLLTKCGEIPHKNQLAELKQQIMETQENQTGGPTGKG